MNNNNNNNNYVPDWIRQGSALWASLVQQQQDDDGGGDADEADATARNSGMPVCAADCADGAQMLRVADFWCVPHSALHTTHFCRAWFALSAGTRAALLMHQTNQKEGNVTMDDPVLGAASLTAAAVALDDAELLGSIPFGDMIAHVRQEEEEGASTRPPQVSAIQDLCMRHDAVRCITLVGYSVHITHGLEPAARAGAANILRRMLQVSREGITGGESLPRNHVERLVLAAMSSARGVRVLEVLLSESEFPEHVKTMTHDLVYFPYDLLEVSVSCGHWDVFRWMLRAVQVAQAAAAANDDPNKTVLPFNPAFLLRHLVIERRTSEIARLQEETGCGWQFVFCSHHVFLGDDVEDGMTVCELAARYGRLDVLAWAKVSGCPWNKEKLAMVAQSDRTRAAIRRLDVGQVTLVTARKRKIAFVTTVE